jgi:hypothetical protein
MQMVFCPDYFQNCCQNSKLKEKMMKSLSNRKKQLTSSLIRCIIVYCIIMEKCPHYQKKYITYCEKLQVPFAGISANCLPLFNDILTCSNRKTEMI